MDGTTASFTPHGKHLIAGEWVATEDTFRSEPAQGEAHDFSVGTPELVDRACKAAEEAFWTYGYTSREERAKFLETIAGEIDARGEAITRIGTSETGLPEARLQVAEGIAETGKPVAAFAIEQNGDAQGRIVARGHNLRVQSGDPTAHAEVVCIRHAGRRRDWPELTLVSTLSPCIMCTGTALLFRIGRVVIGESRNFQGAEELFEQRGVELIRQDDPRCIELMQRFIAEHPDLWHEDIGV